MKNILIIISLSFLFSCGYRNFDANLNLNVEQEKSIIGENIGVQVAVDDSRIKNYVGEKQVSKDKKIYIGLKNSLEKEVRQKFTEELYKKGFVKGDDRIIGIHITKLDYKVKKGFLISDSFINIEAQVVVKAKKTQKITMKTYGINSSRSHLLLPAEQTDEKIINEALSEVIQDILKDDSFVFSLIRD